MACGCKERGVSKSKLAKLSGAAIDTFHALQRGARFDGDLPSKSGRAELIDLGLCRRDRKFEDGKYAGCMMNELTEEGLALAAHYTPAHHGRH